MATITPGTAVQVKNGDTSSGCDEYKFTLYETVSSSGQATYYVYFYGTSTSTTGTYYHYMNSIYLYLDGTKVATLWSDKVTMGYHYYSGGYYVCYDYYTSDSVTLGPFSSSSTLSIQLNSSTNAGQSFSVSYDINVSDDAITTPYTVTLSKGTGISSVSGNGTYNSGTSVSISATPSTGYKFVNWTGYSTSTSNPLTFTIGQNRSYTANATLQTYTVTYSAGTYGSGTNSTATKTYGTALTLKDAQFTRAGYTQTAWASDAAGTVIAYALSDSYTTNAAITLYPYWEPATYTMTIDPNGGSMYNGETLTTDVFTTEFSYNTKTYVGNTWSDGATHYTNNAPTRSGYTFAGFFFSGGSGQKNTSGDTYYFAGENAIICQATGNSTDAYVFNGDYAGDITATAQWTGSTYQVRYNANGGSGSMSSSTHTYGISTALTTNTFTRSGYVFSGWNTEPDGSGTSYTDGALVTTLVTSGTIDLYAQWGESSYQIVFNMNGGTVISGAFDTMTCIRGNSYVLPTGVIEKTNYTFLGWSTSSTATTATYSNGAQINNIGSSGATVILYAVWKAKSFTIMYNINNGTNTTTTSRTYTATSSSNSLLTLPSGWVKDGYIASGWGITTSTISYLLGQSFTGDLGMDDGETLQLYCIWTEESPWLQTNLNIRVNSAWITV